MFDVLPDICIAAVITRGIDNRSDTTRINDLLAAEIDSLRERMDGCDAREHPAIIPYRDAFRHLGVNPNKYPNSIEALARRVLKGSDLPRINPVVDIYTAISLKYLVAMGAHDLERATDDFEVRLSRTGDTFMPIGSSEIERLAPGELVYATGDIIHTRHWIWRQSELGKIDLDCGTIIFPIDGFAGINDDAVMAARDELATLIQDFFKVDTTVGFLDRQHSQLPL